MLRRFAWIVAGGVLLGSASMASAQDPQYLGTSAPANGLISADPGGPFFGPGDGGKVVPILGDHKGCITLYPLTTTYPYSYTGFASGFGNYPIVPWPYAPVGWGWYGTHWRGW